MLLTEVRQLLSFASTSVARIRDILQMLSARFVSILMLVNARGLAAADGFRTFHRLGGSSSGRRRNGHPANGLLPHAENLKSGPIQGFCSFDAFVAAKFD